MIEFGRITDNWSGQRVSVIGAGTSLIGYDFSTIQGITIGANKVALDLNCDILVSIDHNFGRDFHAQIEAYIEAGGTAYLGIPANRCEVEPQVKGAIYLERIRVHSDRMSERADQLQGLNSGFAALNVAYLHRPAKIDIYGFDMRHGRNGTHWHGGYGAKTQMSDKFLRRWAAAFAPAAVQCKKAGIEVINHVGEPGSMIDAFPKEPL